MDRVRNEEVRRRAGKDNSLKKTITTDTPIYY